LIIRTSAFFGPWDDFNFATVALRSLANGLPFRAPADSIVSPTYVPHLVDAVLDLLIDTERGIWHLANDGAVTWYEFVCMVARASNLSESLVQACSWRDIWQPAPRPDYSALTSARGQLLPSLHAAVQIYTDATAVTVLEASRWATS
jgi:dTDP-4-dehydrorhamnose reductase